MAHRKRGKSNDSVVNLRNNLPRRCKDVQPYYAFDIEFEGDEEDHLRGKTRKKELGPWTSALDNVNGKQEDHKQQLMTSTILSWLVDMKVVRENDTICYKNRTLDSATRKGLITRAGIYCCCCQALLSVFEFVLHTGDLFVDVPYENLFIGGTRVSFLTCVIEAWNRHSVPARDGYHHVVRRPRVRDNHDDSCLICADGGDLLCCEKCPSTYHPKCMGFKDVPRGEWQCPYCQCKYCDSDTSSDILLTCFQCSKKYHPQCSDEAEDKILASLQPPNTPFCGKSCLQLYRKLEDMLGKSMPIVPGFSWTLVRRMDLDVAAQNSEDLYVRTKCNSMVALAAKLMEDSFKVIVDRQTRTNIIQSVVYSCGSNFTRTNFSRFYTAALEFRGNLLTVASLRMPSPTLAEIPFIATAESWRNHGMCGALLEAIESALFDMGVKHIVIPSAEEMVSSWKRKKFGFMPVDNEVKKKITTLNTLMFPRTTRLQKVANKKIVDDLNSPPVEEEEKMIIF